MNDNFPYGTWLIETQRRNLENTFINADSPSLALHCHQYLMDSTAADADVEQALLQ